ncbi:MAG: DNA replication/repair protein RecF [Bacteroidales bacterium]
MHLKHLKVNNFRNIESLDMEFCPNVNCFVGENGVGKTNILDAIYYLSFCKSYFNTQDNLNIRNNEEFFSIHGYYSFENKEEEKYSCSLVKGARKQFKCQDKEYSKFSEHIGKIPLVMITPSDQELILGGSEIRRKFIDLVISQADILYLDSLIQYNKALEQRNRLLKYFSQTQHFDEVSLFLWDEQLIRYGKEIYKKRKEFIEDFSQPFTYYYKLISSNKEEISIDYITMDYENEFNNILIENRQKDRVLSYTSLGPHKDDIFLGLDGVNIKKYASQGQQKTFLLALKLAQFEYLYKQNGQRPILLLDDIFDKLDLTRIEQLINLVGSERFGQVFLTDTQIGRIEDIFKRIDIEHKIYNYEQTW